MRNRTLVACLVSLLQGCATTNSAISERFGDFGWSQVHAAAPGTAYRNLFEPLPLGLSSPGCEVFSSLVGGPDDVPILVMVHGIGGDGAEWENSLSLLLRAEPRATFMFRWVSMGSRDAMVSRLAMGVTRLSHCTHHPILILAHSAGGVLASYAAGLIAAESEVKLVTVASPLAGTLARRPAETGEEQLYFLFDLGSRITTYPPAAKSVQVFHLATQYPADHVMAPGQDGTAPNDPQVGVPGATHLTLPADLSHVGALSYVARRIAREHWLGWLATPPSAE